MIYVTDSGNYRMTCEEFAAVCQRAREAKRTTEQQLVAENATPFYIHEKTHLTDSRR